MAATRALGYGERLPARARLGGGRARDRGAAPRRAAALLRTAAAAVRRPGPGEGWARQRFAGPYLRDDLLDRGVLVETLETATSWTALEPVRDAVARARCAARSAAPLVGCHVSHLYPTGASLYFTVLAARDRDDPAGQWRRAKRAASDAIVAAGATITHHHAVGRDHAPWLEAEDGPLGRRAAARRQGSAATPPGS